MKIYRLVHTELFDSGVLKIVKVNNMNCWVATVPENAKIAKSEEECKKVSEAALKEAESSPRKGRYDRMCAACNRLYAVEQELDDFPMEKILQLLYKELSAKDVKLICEKDPWMAERFQDYLKNPFRNKEFKQEFEKLRTTNRTDENIKNLAMLAFANTVLNNINN